jgi:SSS family solute:Na+ symporter
MKIFWMRLSMLCWVFCALASAWAETNSSSPAVANLAGADALAILRDALARETGLNQLRAAESLIALGYPREVDKFLRAELQSRQNEAGYRIGLWCALAQSAASNAERSPWVDRIREVFLDPAAPDRTQAVEALGKLGYTARPQGDEAFAAAGQTGGGALAVNACRVLINSGSAAAENELLALLESDDSNSRLAAQALRQIANLSTRARERLLAISAKQTSHSPACLYIRSAAFVQAGPTEKTALEKELLEYARLGSDEDKVEVCAALAMAGDTASLPVLRQLMGDSAPGVRIGAALATLRIGRRVPHHLSLLDWGVIGLYGLGMLSIGWYYAKRNKTEEDYLLGGRQMKPTAVGISLFASLLSAISYLAYPGEMIKYGPILLSGMVAYPFIIFVVGRFLIPPFMRLPAASGYEILESRLGLSVRMLGAGLFLSLRLLWMAVIIYATTDKVLIPLTGIHPAFKPLVCAVIGIVTIMYTSAGGLRAVVFTDVAQTFILILGAILTLAVITRNMGGIGAWWPTHWYDNWAEPRLWFDSTKRTFAGCFLATFVWNICTCGSDQMAIQRYLATRDVKSARSVLSISMYTTALVSVVLALLGLALLAYYRAHPEMVPDGGTNPSSADRLFPQFIAFGLPMGISGLVVAALFAAAMSALASGLNSTSTVIVVDFLHRFRSAAPSQTNQVRLNRGVSILVGALVVALSLLVGGVPGNLVELSYRVVNLFVAPLFVLFFMAVFIPWATSLGTIIGAAASVAVAVGVAFFHFLGLDFLWIMPCSLIAGAAIGMLASLIPRPKKSKPSDITAVSQ